MCRSLWLSAVGCMATCGQLGERMALPDNERCLMFPASPTFLLSDSRYIGICVVQEFYRGRA
jgi:hypothetical protein